jgi:putative membrane protein
MWGCSALVPFLPGGGLLLVAAVCWMLALVVGILILRAKRRAGKHRRGALADRDDAMRILRARLAEGTISEEDFHRLRRTIEPPQDAT